MKKGARGESRRTGSVNIRLMVCSAKSRRSARPPGPEPGRWNAERFFLTFQPWNCSSPHDHTLHGNFTYFHRLIFCLFALCAPKSPRMTWHWVQGSKAARNKSIDWFPEGNLVSTPWIRISPSPLLSASS